MILGSNSLPTAGRPCAGRWDVYYTDIALVSPDGTVRPLYNRESSISLFWWNTSGVSGEGYEINQVPGNGNTGAAADVSTNYYDADAEGSERMMTSVDGYPVWQAMYAPFGIEVSPQMTVNDYKFAGLTRDPTTGLDQAMLRAYSSTINRWMTPDPLGGDVTNPQSLNRYAYALNNPTTFTDPLGLGPNAACLEAERGAVRRDACGEGYDATMGGGGGGGFSLDGGMTLDWLLFGDLAGSGESYAVCPGACAMYGKDPYTGQTAYLQFTAGAGGARGYLSNYDYAHGVNEVNGTFLSNAQYNSYIQATYSGDITAQRQALATAIAVNSNGTISYQSAFNRLDPTTGHLQGGNYNFEALNGLGPNNLVCGDPRCNGVHFPGLDPATGNYYVHLDTANPFSGNPLNFLEHGLVDVFLGNTVFSGGFIPRPFP